MVRVGPARSAGRSHRRHVIALPLDRKANLTHWESWARTFGGDLRATTKCQSIKQLELDALARHIQRVDAGSPLILEVGCGNGVNGLGLSRLFPDLRYVGVDFSESMVASARENVVARGGNGVQARIAFGVLDARRLAVPLDLRESHSVVGASLERAFPIPGFDVIFTNRMLINLESADEQLEVMTRISEALNPGGRFLMLENDAQSHARLNDIRHALGLPPRPVASFNVFIDRSRVIDPFTRRMELEAVEDVSAIHDLMLYAVFPSLHDGEVRYDTDEMSALTKALLAMKHTTGIDVQGFGQNKLWVWRKPRSS